MPSRGRAVQMVGALNSFKSQESGKHQVIYSVACDADDTATIGTCQILQARMPLCYDVQERTSSLGGRVNRLADLVPADVYCSVADDTLCMTQGWDEAIAKKVAENDSGVFWWTMYYKEYALYAIVTEKWRQAAGRLFTEHFPYWFDDIWLLEVSLFASEKPFEYIEAKLADCPKATHRMRDLAFWHDFWHHTRPQRVKDAKEMAAKLGWPEPKLADTLAYIVGRPVQEFVDSMGKIEAQQGDQGPPSIEYLAAKGRAMEIMGRKAEPSKLNDEFLKAIRPAIEEFDRVMGIRAA